jgi:glutamine amidotransferase
MGIKKFVIVDHGIGNYGSLKSVFNKLGHEAVVSSEKKDLVNSDFLVLSGVGAFPSSIKYLKKNKTIKNLKKIINNGKPILGICLGMHLLSQSSEEISNNNGLGLIPGKIKINQNNSNHIGWNKLNILKKNSNFSNFQGRYFYFQHGYSYNGSRKYLVADTNINSFKIASIIQNNNIVGVQFHPEKSQETGLEFLKQYIEIFK